MSREEALALLYTYLRDEKMIKHCIAVEAVMRSLARKLGEDETLWGLVGLLHDIDYDYVGRDMTKHGLEALGILKDKGLPQEALEAIAGHNEHNGFKVVGEKAIRILHALRASDHISGLIIATALVMPNKKLCEVKPESVMKKFKSKDFARSVSRERIKEVEFLGISLEDYIVLALNALKGISDQLGL